MGEYQKFHAASKSSKGGTANVNKNFDTIERLDHNINSLEYEQNE